MADGGEGVARRGRGRPRTVEAGQAAAPVQALQRALALLSTLAQRDKATLTELALSVGMPPSSAHRLLTTMQAAGYAAYDDARSEWSVGVEAFRAGASFLRRISVVDAARDVMAELVRQTGETANLGAPADDAVTFVSQIETPHPIRAFFGPGARGPMHASGIGKALLSATPRPALEALLQRTGLPRFTEKTRTTPAALFSDLEAASGRGWAFDDEERHLGVRCVAAPIFNAQGEAVAGVSVSGPTARMTSEAVGEYGPLVRRAAARVSERLGWTPPPR